MLRDLSSSTSPSTYLLSLVELLFPLRLKIYRVLKSTDILFIGRRRRRVLSVCQTGSKRSSTFSDISSSHSSLRKQVNQPTAKISLTLFSPQSLKMKKSNSMSSILKRVLCCGMKSFPLDLPEGRVRVSVGKDAPCRFELEANYLNHPLFENLLELSVDEFGYSYDGAVRISCDIDLFQHVLELLDSRNPAAHYIDLPDLISKFYNGKGVQS